MEKLSDQVREYIRNNGPSLPVQVSKALNRDIIFAGAVLSELVSKKELKISKAKIGGSPLYYLKGQEPRLAVLYDYLPQKEKEAYNLLKQKGFINDKKLEPSIRVALIMLKDFAKPLERKNEKIWMWHLEDPSNFTPKKEIKPPIQTTLQKQPKKPRKISKQETFSPIIESYLTQNNLKILQKEIIRKNTETNYTVLVNTQLGPLEFFICAKNKKKITETDLTMAHQKAQSKKMPSLFLTQGELTKKAREHLQKILKGCLIFRKIS